VTGWRSIDVRQSSRHAVAGPRRVDAAALRATKRGGAGLGRVPMMADREDLGRSRRTRPGGPGSRGLVAEITMGHWGVLEHGDVAGAGGPDWHQLIEL